MINLRTVINVGDLNGTAAVVDPINDPVCAAPGAMAAGQGPGQRLADAVWIDRQRGMAEFEHSGRDSLRTAIA